MDEDGGDAKEGKVARNRQGGVAVYLHRSCLQLVPIAKPDGPNVIPKFDAGPLDRQNNPKHAFTTHR